MPRRKAGSIPQQERSRFLVNAVLEAAERVMASSASKATMGAIAKVAGVSIGSLYRYFPARDALVTAVIDRSLERDRDVFRVALQKVEGETLEEALRSLGRAIESDSGLTDPRLLRYLVDVLESVGRLERVREIFDELAYDMADALHGKFPELGDRSYLRRRVHMLFWATRAAYLARLRVEDPVDMDRLREDVLEMCLHFLRPPKPVGQSGEHEERDEGGHDRGTKIRAE